MQTRQKYRCYYKTYENNFGEITLKEYALGETYAESEKKAVANIRYRLKKQYKSGISDLNIVAKPV